MLNPSLKLPAHKRPSITMCNTSRLNNANIDLNRRHMELGNVYPVGGTNVTTQGTHTYYGNDSATYPSESIESFHEPTPSLPPPTPRSLTKKEQQRSRSHREANKGSYGQAMRRAALLHAPGQRPHRPLPERTPEEQRTEPQMGGAGSCEGDVRPKPTKDRRTIISYNLFCRSVGCHRQATTVDGRCCYRCVNSDEPAAMDRTIEDASLICHATIQKVIFPMFITPTSTLNNFAVLLDAIVTVHQIIQNAVDFVVLMKTETMLATRSAMYTYIWYAALRKHTTRSTAASDLATASSRRRSSNIRSNLRRRQ